MTDDLYISDYECPNKRRHSGKVVDNKDNYKALACDECGFVHAVPIPSVGELSDFYRNKFYESERKIDYFEAQAAQKDWWHRLFAERLTAFEKYLGKKGRILDLGCGPGFFLAFAKEQGWEVCGVEPSEKAAAFAREELGVEVHRSEFEAVDIDEIGCFDVVYSHGVIEHLQSPYAFIEFARNLLNHNGLLFVNCANDFNPFQAILREKKEYPCWWFVPPEHLNYFTVKSLKSFIESMDFEVVDKKTSFPIDMFLLMGDDYINDPKLGKECHKRIMSFEKTLEEAGKSELKDAFYKAMAQLDIGRQINMIARKL